MKTFEFLKIKFSDFKSNKIDILLKKNFLVFPAAPALSSMKINSNYHKALQNADFVLLDSGLLVLLFNIFRGTNLKKFSGYKFLHLFLRRRKTRNEKILLINPDFKSQKNNINFIRKFIKEKNIYSYIAPQYDSKKIKDRKLLTYINSIQPKNVLINLGGGTQEILGFFLKQKLKYKLNIICTGAAISFMTKDQAPINTFLDKIYLGWLTRIIFNPKIYLPRYLKALKLLIIFFKKKTNIYG